MKVEFYEETTIQKKQRFIADDGTIFDTEYNCIEYEERCKLDAMPYPATMSVPIPLDEDCDINIALLKSPLDFKKLLMAYEDEPEPHNWDLFGMEQPTNYPCLYTYIVDGAHLDVSSLIHSPTQLIQDYAEVARTMAAWCAEQLEKATTF